MATIQEHIRFGEDNKIGNITAEGEIYGYLEDTGEEEYIGRVDYEEGVVYLIDEDGELALGWVDDEGRVISSLEDDDEFEIGYVKDNGDLFYYVDENDAQHVGQVVDMKDPVEGAAALLIFFDYEEDDFEDEE